jgi:amino acid transporter
MRLKRLFEKNMSAERISSYTLYGIICLIVLVLAAFFFIGYDNVYEMDPTLKDPLCTDVLIVFMYVMIVITTVIAVASVVRSVRMRNSESVTNGIHEAKITYLTAGSVVVLLALTFLFGSSTPVRTGEGSYANAFWLKVTDMFLYTTYVLLVLASAAAIYGMAGLRRKKKR